MNQLPDYLLKLSFGLSLIWLFYYLVLRRLTFYNWNRRYLLLYSALAFGIPLVNLNQTLPSQQLVEIPILPSLPAIPAVVETRFIASEGVEKPSTVAKIALSKSSNLPFAPIQAITGLIALGIAFLLLRLGLQLLSYFRIKQQAQLVSDEDGVKVYHVARPIVPFSFGRAIFFNPDLHDPQDLRDIMRHELVHVQQRHTVDILFAEVLCALNWYNPFAWLIRHAIRQNLEFIADREVLENGTEARTYQFLLLKVAGVPEFRLANQFNFSSLKQRIIMMNRLKSAQVHLLRFLFVVPLLFILLVACRTETEEVKEQRRPFISADADQPDFVYLGGILMDAELGKPLAGLSLEKTVSRVERGGKTWRQVPIETLETITTDKDGYYYWRIDVRNQEEKYLVYELKPKEEKYANLSLRTDYDEVGSSFTNYDFDVRFLTSGKLSSRQDFTRIFQGEATEIPRPITPDFDSEQAKELLLKRLPELIDQNRLIVDFKKRYWKPTKTLTKFRNGYFNKERQLVGYEDVLELYLDGEKASHEEINREFEGYLIKPARMDPIGWYSSGICKKLFYLTFPLFRQPPPKALLADQNVEWIDAENFNLALLKNEPYVLDGFRQTYGVGSNLMPRKQDIKRVAIFKGDLARYYDRKLDKLWWIETRPAEEVMERPDFVAR